MTSSAPRRTCSIPAAAAAAAISPASACSRTSAGAQFETAAVGRAVREQDVDVGGRQLRRARLGPLDEGDGQTVEVVLPGEQRHVGAGSQTVEVEVMQAQAVGALVALRQGERGARHDALDAERAQDVAHEGGLAGPQSPPA